MALGVELKSVALLLDKIYFIRSYQRGYRWDEDQLNDLLYDFKEFIDNENKREDEFYCLQPIVVKKLTNQEKGKTRHTLINHISEADVSGKDIFEVIDGQQRLTTLQLILSFLQNDLQNIKISFFPKIIYEVRPDSAGFLEKFRDQEQIDGLKKKSIENIDFHHMYKIYMAISNWFSKNENYKEKVLKLLTSLRINNVRVIWYEVSEDENSIAVFRRFNIGKIPLNNAELIKAVLLKDDNNLQPADKYIISQQWEKFENQLQDDFFWSFLQPNKKYDSKIEYLFDLLYQLDESDKTKFGNDKFKIFRYFNDLLLSTENEILSVWDKVSDLFEELNQFYNHPEHYHYIGFLNNKEKNSGFNIKQVIKLLKSTDSAIRDKESMTEHLFEIVKSNTRHFFKDGLINLDYDSKKVDLRDFFLLLNVETTKNLNNAFKNEFAYRFSFNKYRETSFDIEHIGSQTDKEPKNDEEKIDYIRNFYTDYFNEINEEFKNELIEIVLDKSNGESDNLWETENINLELLNNKFQDIDDRIKTFIEEYDKLIEKNSIGNLTLLNSDINRSYGNAFFPTKRKQIIQKDIEGKFILPSTKNVFLKYYSQDVSKHTRWTDNDVVAYKSQLNSVLEKYL